MVADGEADVCAVDCVTCALWADSTPDVLDGTRVLTTTAHAPSLPYVTHRGRSDEDVLALRRGLLAAAEDSSLEALRRRLRLAGFSVLPPQVYDCIGAMEQRAAELGYPDLV